MFQSVFCCRLLSFTHFRSVSALFSLFELVVDVHLFAACFRTVELKKQRPSTRTLNEFQLYDKQIRLYPICTRAHKRTHTHTHSCVCWPHIFVLNWMNGWVCVRAMCVFFFQLLMSSIWGTIPRWKWKRTKCILLSMKPGNEENECEGRKGENYGLIIRYSV